MKKTIWQKIDRRIGRLKIFRNSAVLIKKVITTDPVSGKTTVTADRFSIQCPAPENVRADLIDQTLVQAGDLSLVLDHTTLKDIWDRAVTEDWRWDESRAFLTPGTDEIAFGGILYSVRKVIPEDWQNNQPGQYRIILRSIADSEEDDLEIQTE